MTREEQRSRWRAIVEKQIQSGLNAAAFCREQHLKVSQFYRWHRKFRNNENPEPASGGFLQLVPCKEQDGSGVRIRLREGVSIEVEPGFDLLTLRRAVHALSSSSVS